MKPRGPLMIEHRLIEKVLKVVADQLSGITVQTYNPLFTETIVDFIRTYADRTHHGKEEQILFARLSAKPLEADDKRVMQELIDEHIQARKKVKELVELNEIFKTGRTDVVNNIQDVLRWLTVFYPPHIKKEDDIFFPRTEKYFSPAEQDELLRAFAEFDRTMIHEKYKQVYLSLSESSKNQK